MLPLVSTVKASEQNNFFTSAPIWHDCVINLSIFSMTLFSEKKIISKIISSTNYLMEIHLEPLQTNQSA